MPVRGTGGISRANLAGVVHLEREGNALEASLNVNQKVPSATLQVLDGNVSLFSEKADLTPEKTWIKKSLYRMADRKLTFDLQDAHGVALLRQTEGNYDWTPESEISVGPQSNYRIPGRMLERTMIGCIRQSGRIERRFVVRGQNIQPSPAKVPNELRTA